MSDRTTGRGKILTKDKRLETLRPQSIFLSLLLTIFPDLSYPGERLCRVHGDQQRGKRAVGGEGGPGGRHGECDGEDRPRPSSPQEIEIDLLLSQHQLPVITISCYMYYCVITKHLCKEML